MLNIGDTIHLELVEKTDITKNQETESAPKKYRCKLIDKEEGSFIVNPPVNEETGKTGFFMEGVQLNAWFIGTDQAVYALSTEVKGRASDKIRSLRLQDPGSNQYARIQRRNYVRIDASIDVAVYPEKKEFSPFVTSTIDISGGGMAILLPLNYGVKEKDKITTWIVLQGMEGVIHYAKVSCEVIRIIEGRSGAKDRCSLKFESITDNDRQKIIKYCFEQQLHMGRNNKSRNR
ncbi:pilus assembly protein PilZ [Salibacterium salarium]|uniref:Pilus assembly protein PilZ n=1 Tax=Salibacterium salarium TaxID=284579 RepID=A0A428N4R9_9BACI|nr:flagellar brake domain-containing protein [Salibacterium salarium]RSL33484.1 pilus assembly protein PilZ [Salibacterium salarium]